MSRTARTKVLKWHTQKIKEILITYTERIEEINISSELLLAGIKIEESGQKKFLHQRMAMMEIQEKLSGDVPSAAQRALSRLFFCRGAITAPSSDSKREVNREI